MCERNSEGCSSGCCSECDFDEWVDFDTDSDSSDDEDMETLETSEVRHATDAREIQKIEGKRKRKRKGKTADITYLGVKSLQNVAEESSGVVYAMILKYQNMR